MQEDPEIIFKNIDVSPALEARIRERIDRLERFHHGIVGCRVVVREAHRSPASGKNPLRLDLEVRIPGDVLHTGGEAEIRETKDNTGNLVTRVFEAMERQLDGVVARGKRRVKAHTADHEIGVVTRLFASQGYGFVQVGEGPELYFTENVLQGLSMADLVEGMPVVVSRAHDDGPMGPLANAVRRLGDSDRMPF
ncbi:MAG: HPF/RaiA family ribosome-associated protein [Alphaproteobacteria bacterium]